MATYDRETTVESTFEDVWEFNSRISGLEAVTPDWMNLRVEHVIGPDGEAHPDVLEHGSEVALSIRPFGVGPRQHWTSVITDREREEGSAYFRDEMVHGPFDRWEHTHTFYADGDRTVIRDRVQYELPLGGIGDAVAPLSKLGFEAMFRTRHRLAKARLE
ncbi:SRPBCC family protein [Natrinema halophilum]|uniref:SRPBCC family protein n=1 Tax=Natrinema halophilum TaxID=1699371 RepID=A0A7D5KB32_9EURY|nr:SRPBCC family protein [Natrinema halophilum]QLG47441.1 SRPBCC family protein [Natrinema halophilum]